MNVYSASEAQQKAERRYIPRWKRRRPPLASNFDDVFHRSRDEMERICTRGAQHCIACTSATGIPRARQRNVRNECSPGFMQMQLLANNNLCGNVFYLSGQRPFFIHPFLPPSTIGSNFNQSSPRIAMNGKRPRRGSTAARACDGPPFDSSAVAARASKRLRGVSEGHAFSVPERAARQLRLHGALLLPAAACAPAPAGAVRAARSLFGLQAQDANAAALALWNRIGGPFGAPAPEWKKILAWFGADAGATGLVRCHGQRGTIHVYDRGTWPVVCAMVKERLLERRRKTAGEDALREAHDRLRRKLEAGASVGPADLPGADASLRYSTFMSLTLEGLGTRTDCSRGTVIAPRSSVAPDMKTWDPPEEHCAVVQAARVYFNAFAPATEADFRYYMGITAAPSRAAVAELRDGGELVEIHIAPSACFKGDTNTAVTGMSTPALITPAGLETLRNIESSRDDDPLSQQPVLLLGRFDILLLGHVNKDWLLDPSVKHHVWSSTNMDIRSVLLVRGRVCGVWRSLWTDKQSILIKVDIFQGVKLSKDERCQLDQRAALVATGFYGAVTWDLTVSVLE
jgi:hypothetical protein